MNIILHNSENQTKVWSGLQLLSLCLLVIKRLFDDAESRC